MASNSNSTTSWQLVQTRWIVVLLLEGSLVALSVAAQAGRHLHQPGLDQEGYDAIHGRCVRVR